MAQPPQQPPSPCIGGHFTLPNEQNTQQSPGFGRSTVPHPVHSWKNRHASTGIVSVVCLPHSGHVNSDSRIAAFPLFPLSMP